MKVKSVLFTMLLVSSFILASCQPQPAQATQPVVTAPTEKIRIAMQFGLGYAPLTIAQEKKLFEKYLPGVEIEWKQLGSGSAINEAMIAGEVDAAVMGIPPFLVAWDKGVPVKVALGMCVMPLGLETYRDDVQSLADFSAGDKIAYPGPGSIQHILLSMAAEKELGDAKALDGMGVAMAHPDGAAALLTKKDISAHFTAPPYNFEELSDPSIHQVVDGFDAFGGQFSFLIAVTTQDFFSNHPQAYSAFVMGLSEAIDLINQDSQEAAKILAPSLKLDEQKTLSYLTWEGMNYTSTPYGLMGFAEFMQRAGYIERVPASLSDIAWYNVVAAIGRAQGEASPIEKLQYRP